MCVRINIHDENGIFLEDISLISELKKYAIELDEQATSYVQKEAMRLHLPIEQIHNTCMCNLSIEKILNFNDHIEFKVNESETDRFDVFLKANDSDTGDLDTGNNPSDTVEHNMSLPEWIKIILEDNKFAVARIHGNVDEIVVYQKVIKVFDNEDSCDEIISILNR